MEDCTALEGTWEQADLEQSLRYRITVLFLFATKSNYEPDKVP